MSITGICREALAINISLIRDEAALRLVKDLAFQQSWKHLAQQDPKFTLIQEPAFVSTWYHAYQALYEPVMVLAHTGEGQLAGLMPLAIHKKDGYLTHAGDEIGEYHGWIASPSIDEAFILASLKEIQQTLAPKSWKWGWMPPGTPTGWLTSAALNELGITVLVETAPAPYWNLTDPSKLSKVNKRKNVKRSIRQYQQRGTLRYERIMDKERTRELLAEFAEQSDFKKEALYNYRFFEKDPCILEFMTGLQDFPETNHFSVLWLDNYPLAFNHALCDGQTLCLAGYTSYDPSESKHSPGKIHLIELARTCTEEGYTEIDLSPGKDAYKDRFATEYKDLSRIQLFFSPSAFKKGKIKAALKEKVLDLAAKAGLEDGRRKVLQTDIKALPQKLKALGVSGCLERVGRGMLKRQTMYCYKVGKKINWEIEDSPYTIHINRYKDLLAYQAHTPFATRRELLMEALQRFSRGDNLYSVVYGDRLVMSVWVREGKYALSFPGMRYEHQFPEDSVVVYGWFADPSFDDPNLKVEIIHNIVEDCVSAGTEEIYLCMENLDGIPPEFFRAKKMRETFRLKYTGIMNFLHMTRGQNIMNTPATENLTEKLVIESSYDLRTYIQRVSESLESLSIPKLF